MDQKLLNFLVWPCNKHTFLLLIQRDFEFFLYLPPCFAIKCLTLVAFQRDACSPSTIIPLINGPITMSSSCHNDTSFLYLFQNFQRYGFDVCCACPYHSWLFLILVG